MRESNSLDMTLNVGDKVNLKVSRESDKQVVEVVYVGPYSVKVKDEGGRIVTLKTWEVRNQLFGRPKRKRLTQKQKRARQREFEERAISTPTGGQPGYRR
jgi:hypothetical protein